ncbi:MAG: sensor histidine kinase [Flavobacteriales bacterium]
MQDEWELNLLSNIRSTRYFTSYATREYLGLGLFYGILIFVLLYNLMIFINTREKLYLHYVLFVLSGLFTCALQDGIALQFLWPSHSFVGVYVDNLSRILTVVAFSFYTFHFFEMDRYDRRMKKFIVFSLLTFLPIFIVKEYVFSDAVYSFFYIVPFALIYIAALRAAIRKFKPAYTFLTGYSIFLLTIVISIFRELGLYEYSSDKPLLEIFLVYILYFGMVIEYMFFSFGLAQRLRFLKKENEQLEFFNLEAEYKLLKNQVNPHFIFNTFETMKYLSRHDPDKAEIFINHLSEFMRTSLKNDKGIVTMEEEMQVLNNYLYLQEVRFSQALRNDIADYSAFKNFRLPYFSLVTLVENAIKHNVLTQENPLCIKIVFTAGHIEISNNLQKKKQVENSTRIGLHNLNERCKLLCGSGITIEETEIRFVVKLKLLEP